MRLHATIARHEWPHRLLVFALLILLYLFTAPRTVVLEDDGLFILSSWFLGIEHPPGYPLFVLLGKLATLFPFGTVAWRVHALSGLFAAIACVLIYDISRRLTPGRAPAYLAALGLGVSATFWSQALIADVYTLHALLFFALFSLAIAGTQIPATDEQTLIYLYLSALLAGCGVANHWPLLAVSGPALAVLWLPRYRLILQRLPSLMAAFAVGLLPYAWMVWRSHQQPEISFQGPIDSWTEFVRFFLRANYAGVDEALGSDGTDRLLYLAYLVRQAMLQMLPVGALLALVGAFKQWTLWGVRTAAAMTLAFLGPTLFLVLLLGFDYQALQREVFRVYPIVAWGILALWAGLGLRVVVDRLPSSRRQLAAGTVASALIVGTLAVHWTANSRFDDTLAHRYGAALLSSLAPDAILLARGDLSVPAPAYLHLVEGLRPDITLLNSDALLLEPKLFDPANTPPQRVPAILDAYINASLRPVYRLANKDDRSGTLSWLTFRVDTQSRPGDGAVRFTLSDPERNFLIWLADIDRFNDGWSEYVRRLLLTRFVSFHSRADMIGESEAQRSSSAADRGFRTCSTRSGIDPRGNPCPKRSRHARARDRRPLEAFRRTGGRPLAEQANHGSVLQCCGPHGLPPS